VVRWRRVGSWRLRIVLRLVPLLGSESIADYQRAISLLERRRDCPGGIGYIVVVLFVAWSTSDIERGSVLRSLLLIYIHTSLSLRC
jgi:hypothetical protein